VWEFEHEVVANVDKGRAWALLSDVTRWSQWNPGIADAALDGPFAVGSRGSSRARGGPPSALEIVDVQDGRSCATVATLPLLRLRFEYRLQPVPGGRTKLGCHVQMTGPSTLVYKRTLGPRLRQSIPLALRTLVEQSAA
jgi:hypothetical protein